MLFQVYLSGTGSLVEDQDTVVSEQPDTQQGNLECPNSDDVGIRSQINEDLSMLNEEDIIFFDSGYSGKNKINRNIISAGLNIVPSQMNLVLIFRNR